MEWFEAGSSYSSDSVRWFFTTFLVLGYMTWAMTNMFGSYDAYRKGRIEFMAFVILESKILVLLTIVMIMVVF